MYGIIYNNRENKNLECIGTFESFKIASNELYNVISKFIDIEPTIRPCTIWKTQEFDENKIKANPQVGFWIKLNEKEAIIYQKTFYNGWFSSFEIKEIGSFIILDLPEISKVTVKHDTKNKNTPLCKHTFLIEELKDKLKKRNTKNTPIIIPDRPTNNYQPDFLLELKKGIQRINKI